MKINHQLVVFDAADIEAESAFWAGVLGGEVDGRDDWHNVVVDGRPQIAVQLAPDHVPPDWPDGNPQQVHLDLWVDELGPAHEHDVARCAAAQGGRGPRPGQLPGLRGPGGAPVLPLLVRGGRPA